MTDEREALDVLRSVAGDGISDYDRVRAAMALLDYQLRANYRPPVSKDDKLATVALVVLGTAALVASLALMVWAVGGMVA